MDLQNSTRHFKTMDNFVERASLFDFMEKAAREAAQPEKPKKKRAKKPKRVESGYEAALDEVRLTGLQLAVFQLMSDGKWRTHTEIKDSIQRGSENGIAAVLRNLRAPERGEHTVNKRRRGDPTSGCWEYQLIVNQKDHESQ